MSELKGSPVELLSLDHRRIEPLIVAGLLGCFLVISFLSVRHKSPTADEDVHLAYGIHILNGNSDRLRASSANPDDSKMPFSALNALPAKFGALLPDGYLKRFSQTTQAGRPVTILFSTLIAFFLYAWAKELYGKTAASFTLFLFVLEPSVIAHSQLVTTDAYGMGMIMLATYALWRFNRKRTVINLVVVGILMGLSEVAKYSAVFLVPVFILIQLLHDSQAIWGWIKSRNLRSIVIYLRAWVLGGAVIVSLSLLVINAAYLFNNTFMPLGDYSFRSSLFQTLQARLTFLRGLPLPVPYPYLQGLDLVKYRDEVWYGFARIFLLGRLSIHGFPGYYFYDIGLKAPLPLLAAIVGGLIMLFRRRPSLDHLLKNEAALIIPVVWYLIYMNYMLHAQLGIRLILVIFPFLLILAGNLARGINQFLSWRLGASVLLGSLLTISVLSYFPNFLAYFNEIVWDRRTTYRYLADSDLNWRGNIPSLKTWLADHPKAVLDPAHPVVGLIVADPNKLDGIPRNQPRDKYAWLRDNFDPVDIVANTYPVFQVTREDLARLGFDTSP